MTELRKTRWITYTRTPRSLQPGDQGRGWLRTTHPTAMIPTPHTAEPAAGAAANLVNRPS